MVQLIGRLRQVNWLAVAQGVQSIATTVAIIVGGWWTYKTFIEGREPFPKAGLEHALTVVPLTGERTLLHLGITITNKGQRIIRPDYGEIRVQQILPLANCPPPCAREAILNGGDPVLPDETVVRWPMLGHRRNVVQPGGLQIEPGEADTIYADFVVPSRVEVLQIYSFFGNATQEELGWKAITYHDLREEQASHDEARADLADGDTD